jgi:hypothetical protein
MKKSCCNIYECNNNSQIINCDPCCIKSNCGYIELCTQDASHLANEPINKCEKIKIKIKENIFFEIIKKIKCEYKCEEYENVGCILIGSYFYLFVQLTHSQKRNVLYVIQGKVNTDYIAIDDSVIIQMCYNLYNSFKNEKIDKKLTKDLKIIQVLYNYYDDMFILLMCGHGNTILGEIEHLESIHSVGTYIDFVYTSPCDLLIIKHHPIHILIMEKKTYKIVVYDEHHKHNKCYVLEF